MRFNSLFIAVALQTLVSALPLYSVPTYISERGIDQIETRSEANFWPELAARNNDVQWELSLRKHDVEYVYHWGLYLHPAGIKTGGTICEAKSTRTHQPGISHLETVCIADTRDDNPVTLTLLGPIGSTAKKDQAVELLKNVRCETPQENCVDCKWTTLANMENEYREHADKIREYTAVHFTKPTARGHSAKPPGHAAKPPARHPTKRAGRSTKSAAHPK